MSFKREILEKLAALITAAFGLVAALAWNEAIQEGFKTYVRSRVGEGGQLQVMFAYAGLVTVAAVLATVWVSTSIARVEALKFPSGWSRELRNQPPPPPL